MALALSAAGCSSDDSSSSSSSSGATPDAGGTMTLYQRLGGKAGLESFVKTVVETKILTDADLKTYFFSQVATPIPAGKPSATQIVVCFGRFVGAALKEDTYPGAPVNDPANTNNPNHTCRDMLSSHGTLNIGTGTFDKFIGYIATSLMPLVKPTATKAGEITQAEFDALAAALNGTKTDIVTTTAPANGPFVKP
jgi:hypothetical protein